MYQALLSMQLISQLEGKGLMTGASSQQPARQHRQPGNAPEYPSAQPRLPAGRCDASGGHPAHECQPCFCPDRSISTDTILLWPLQSSEASDWQQLKGSTLQHATHSAIGRCPSVQPVSQGILEHEPVKVLHICVGCHLHLICSALQGVDLLTLIQTQASGFERVQSAVVGTPPGKPDLRDARLSASDYEALRIGQRPQLPPHVKASEAARVLHVAKARMSPVREECPMPAAAIVPVQQTGQIPTETKGKA